MRKEGLNYWDIWIKRREGFGGKKLVMIAVKKLLMVDWELKENLWHINKRVSSWGCPALRDTPPSKLKRCSTKNCSILEGLVIYLTFYMTNIFIEITMTCIPWQELTIIPSWVICAISRSSLNVGSFDSLYLIHNYSYRLFILYINNILDPSNASVKV